MASSTLSRIGRLALDLLYPPACALCGRGGALLCAACEASLPRADGRRCWTCWLPVSASTPCRHCSTRPLAFAALRSPFRYEGPARELVHRFKFRDIGSLAEVMATPMTGLVDWQVEAVVPVPLSGRRQRERGYNQSRLLAKHVAAGLDVPVVDALRHTRFSPPQAGGLTREQRFANVANAFAVSEPSMVRGRSLLLVDDVATTGATLDACATTLLDAGARVVTAVTFARD